MVLRKPTYGRARLVAFKPRACLRRVPVDYWSYDHTYCTVSYPFRSDVRNQINAIVTMRRVARRQATSSDTVHHPLQSARAQRTLFLRTPSFPMELGPDFAFSWGLSNISRSTITTYALLSDPATLEKANEIFAKMRRRLFEVLTVPVPDLQDKSIAQVLNVHVTAPSAPSPDLREELTLLESSINSSLDILSQGMNAIVSRVNESVEAPKGRAGSKPSAQKLLHSKSSPSSAQTPAQLKPSTIFCFCHAGCFQA